jgi:hypothetical protein
MTIAIAAARASALIASKESDNPFAAWNNLGALATLGGTSVLSDGAALNAFTGTTYDYWLPNVTATTAQLQVTFGAARSLSCVAIAAHNLHLLGASIAVQRSTNGGANWSDAGAGVITPTDGSPIIFRMVTSGNDAADWRLNITGLVASAPLYIGVAFFGDDMVFPVRFYDGFAPPVSPNEVQMGSNVTQGGNLAGSSVVQRGSTMQASFEHVVPAFVRGAMAPFIPYFNAGKGFFFAWRPATYPQDAVYGWREGEVLRPVNAGGLNFMSFAIAARCYEG